MMKRIWFIALSTVLCIAFSTTHSSNIFAQDQASEEKDFGLKISGYVKNDIFWDTRQTVAAREGHFLLWPSPVVEGTNGADINGNTNFNFLAVQSRLKFTASGPDAFGAKSSAVIEGDFFAQSNANINLFRLRHAFVKLNWENLELLAGQYWNPLMVTASFPGTVSFNTGAPLQSFSRNPQVRVTYSPGPIHLIAALLSQRDHTSVGASGASSAYLRNSALPDMHLQVHFSTDEASLVNLYAGAGLAYKIIAPRLQSTTLTGTYAVDERVAGLTLIGFAKVAKEPLTFKIQGRYGENMADLLAFSGFAATEILDPLTGERSYSPLRNLGFWAEVHSNGNPQFGIFGGLSQNIGSKEEILSALQVYGRSVDIHSLYRISPRIIYNTGKLRLALELDYTQAAYGSDWDDFYLPGSTQPADNLRVLGAIYYFF